MPGTCDSETVAPLTGGRVVVRTGALDIILIAATIALVIQLALQWDLGLWIIDQGKEMLWAESIAAGRRFPTLGPAASGLQIQGPAYYYWAGALWKAGIPGWWEGLALYGAVLAQAALLARAHRRLGEPRGLVLGLGLAFGHVGLSTLFLTPTAPSWVPLLSSLVLAVISGAERLRTTRAAIARFSVVGFLWVLTVQFHVTALVAAPAIAVATLLAPRRLRLAAVAGEATGCVVGMLLLSGGVQPTLAFVEGLLAQQTGAATAPLAVRLGDWLVMPWKLAAWWRSNGVLGALGIPGAIAHWVAVLLGLGLAAVAVRRIAGARRMWLVVLLTWAAGGLLYPVPVRTTAFYYLVGALPALTLRPGPARRCGGGAPGSAPPCWSPPT